MLRFLVGAVVLLVSSASAEVAPLVVVETLDSETTCRLERLDLEAGVLSFSQETQETPAEDPLRHVLAIRFGSRRALPGDKLTESVVLIDGSSFFAVGHTLEKDTIDFELAGGGQLRVALSEIRRWQLAEGARGQLAEAAFTELATDRLLVRGKSGEGLTPVDGIVLGIDPEGITFRLGVEAGGDVVRAPWRRIAGMSLYRRARETTPPVAVVLVGGERFAATSVALEERLVRWAADGGVRGSVPLSVVARIELAADRVIPAGQMPLLASDWTPYGDVASEGVGIALGRSLGGGPIRLRSRDTRAPAAWPGVFVTREFTGGVALASRGVARFSLPPRARRVKCLVGLDPATAGAGDCQVSLLLGERVAWSARVAGDTLPAHVVVDPQGAQTLTLRVDYGANLDAGDRVHFADLRVIR